MISYKNVGRFKYTQNPSDVVALKEYILYEDGKNNTRHALLKFVNNLDQPLYGIEFEVYQYDGDDKLIEKALVVYDKFTANEYETFVPKAKLTLSVDCARITVKLISAAFDRIRWEKGEFVDNVYSFERYVADEKPQKQQKKDSALRLPSETEEPKAKKKKKERTSVFSAVDVTHKNIARFPTAFCVLAAIVVVVFAIVTAALFRYGIGFYLPQSTHAVQAEIVATVDTAMPQGVTIK